MNRPESRGIGWPGSPDLVLVPAGAWLVGSADDPGAAPARRVRLPAFRVATAPVTNAEWNRFVETTGRPALPFAADERLGLPDRPAVGVSWLDAVAYLEWLSAETGLACRLPNEAEREVAARGGLEDLPWPWGAESPERVPRLADIACADRPHVPGPACANAWGLACMADNVHEWCHDWHAPGRRASRGGSWRHAVPFTRVFARSSLPPDRRYADYGLRVFADA